MTHNKISPCAASLRVSIKLKFWRGNHDKETHTAVDINLIRKTRFRFHLSRANKNKGRKRQQKLTNSKMCVQFYHKYEANYEEHVVKINFFTGKGRENVVNNEPNLFRFSKSNQVTWEAAKLLSSTTAAAVTTKTAPASANKYLVTVAWTIMSYDWLVESGMSHPDRIFLHRQG